MKVIKYTGPFGSASAEDLVFKRGVPTIVPKNALALVLLKLADFEESSLEELEAHLNPEPAPAPKPAAPTQSKKEIK